MNKKQLYESIMKNVAKEVKRVLNEVESNEHMENEYGEYEYGVTLYEINLHGGAYGFDEYHFNTQEQAINFARTYVSNSNIPMIAECFTIYDNDEPDVQMIRGKKVVFYPSYDDEWKYVIANIKSNKNFDIDEVV